MKFRGPPSGRSGRTVMSESKTVAAFGRLWGEIKYEPRERALMQREAVSSKYGGAHKKFLYPILKSELRPCRRRVGREGRIVRRLQRSRRRRDEQLAKRRAELAERGAEPRLGRFEAARHRTAFEAHHLSSRAPSASF